MSPNPSKGYDRCFCIRMKSTLTKRGVHFKSSGYRVVQIVAHLRPQVTYPVAQKQLPPLLGLVGMAIALPPPTITELIIDNDMFITRLSPQFKVTYCEPRIADMMDITSEDLMNKNLYDHCHAEDLQKLNKAHTDLLNKGQVLTDYYRLMNRHGGYVWIQTCATIICNAKNAEEQNVIAINYVLSGVEYAGCVMNLDQFRILSKSDPDLLTRPDSQSDPTTDSERSAVVSLPHHNTDDGHFGACESSKTQYRLTKTAEIGSSPNHFDQFGSSSSLAPAGHDDAALRSAAEGELRGSSGRVELLFERTGTSSMIAKTQGKGDPKNNSRRKMEKPRKRKRLSDGDAETKVAKITTERSSTSSSSKSGLVVNAGNNNDEADKTEKPLEKPLTSSSSSSLTDVDDMPLGVGLSGGGGGRGSHEYNGRTSSPTPEDLSTGRPATSPAEDEARNQHDDSSTDLMASGGTAAGMGPWLLRSAGNAAPSYPQDGTASSSSVLDLEEAMNKHLPVQTTSVSDHHALGYGPHQQVLGGLQRHKSTIQWIGAAAAAAEAHGTPHGAIGGSELSASTLLRSLYPSRESVIRTNIYSSRPQQYYDIQNALLTPPGGGGGGGGGSGGPDVYKDSFSSVSLLNHHSKTPTDGGGGGGGGGGSYGLTTNCYAATSALGLGGMTAADAAAAYSMTPPSSVSPQENYMSQFLDMHLHADRVMMQQYCTSGGGNGGGGTHQGHRENPVAALSMPIIRPQAYSLPAAHGGSSHHHHLSAYEHHAMPYHAGGYYASNVGVAAYNYVTGGSNASHYRDAMKNVNSW